MVNQVTAINLNLVYYFLTYVLLSDKTHSSEVLRPRGVSLSRAALYNPEKNFVCFDGTVTIPFSYVNDDYCDCPDASDEPGTSACPHGIFHCTNAGHKPLNIPSSRVNDGICDCCDGTDEYANAHVKCSNNCLELGRSAREEAQRRAELIKSGKQLRSELSQQGKRLKQEKLEKLEALQKNRVEADKVKEEKEALKKEIEVLEGDALARHRQLEEEERNRQAEVTKAQDRDEAIQTFHKFDSDQDGRVVLGELQSRETFDKDRNGEVSVEEAKYFLNEQESVDLPTFVDYCWPNIKPYLMRDAGIFKPPATAFEQEDLQDGTAAPEETDEEQDESEPEPDEHEETEDGEELEDGEEEDEQQEEQPPPSNQFDEETQKLVDQAAAARNEFNEAERAVRELETEIKKLEDFMEIDFGPEEEFSPLLGECFDFLDHEYIYLLCPFDKTTQKQKSSSSETRLGTWSRWVGPEENKYEAMLFENGQACWNGPQRSTRVVVSCGGENKVSSVTEPNRCEYLFEFATPAACREVAADSQDDVHDEL